MSQPRHQPKGGVPVSGADGMKLKLRIPADGSVDLDDLRRALEELRDRKPQPPVPPEPEIIPEPEVVPKPGRGESREPSWLVTWFGQNKLVAAAIGLALIAFISGITWLMQSQSAIGGSTGVVWVFWLTLLGLCGVFGQVLRTHLAAQPKDDEPSETLAWIRKNAATVVSLFCAVTAFVVGLLWVGQYTAANKSQPSLVWAFWILVGIFSLAFSFVIRKQLAVEDSFATTAWAKVKAKPIVALSSVMGVVVLVALVFVGLSKLQTSPSTDSAKADSNPAKSVQPNPPLPIEPPPVKPPIKGEPDPPPTPPVTPEVEEPSGPAPGWGGRLMTAGIASSLLFGGLFMVTRQRKKKFINDESLKYGASLGEIHFWRGLRYFIAGHGGFYLFAAMIGLLYTVHQLPFVELGGVFLISLLTIPVAAGAVLALGYAGINLMPMLDLKVARTHRTATIRFLKQKSLLATVMGLAIAAFMALLNNDEWPIELWSQIAAMNSVTYGILGAYIWKLGGLAANHESVTWPDSKTPERARTALLFNLPLWGGLTVGANLLFITVTDLGWRDFWWLSFITGAVVAGLVAVLRTYQRLLMNIHHTIVWAGLGTMVFDYFWDGPIWFWPLFAASLAIMAVVMGGVTSLSESGRYFIVPPTKKPFKKVIETTRDGVNVQWGNLTAAAAFLLLFTGTALGWVWSGTPPVEENDESSTVTNEQAEIAGVVTPETSGGLPAPGSSSFRGREAILGKTDLIDAINEHVHNNRSPIPRGSKIYFALTHFRKNGNPLASYNFAFAEVVGGRIIYRDDPAFINESVFVQAANKGHVPSMFNCGIISLNRVLDDRQGFRRTPDLIRKWLYNAEHYFALAHKNKHARASQMLDVVYFEMSRRNIEPKDIQLSGQISGAPLVGPLKLDRSDILHIQ